MLKLLIAAVFAAGLIIAQDVTATITGTVVDPHAAAVAGATVRVISKDRSGEVRKLSTSKDGSFVASLLAIGDYSVKVEAPGFSSLTEKNITLHVNDNLTLHFELKVGSVSDSIDVEANAVAVQMQSPSIDGLINGTEIRELALNNRNYTQLLNLMPGVTNTSDTDEVFIGRTNPSGGTNVIPYSVSGGRTSGNNFMVDGADNVDRGSNATLLMTPSVDSIAEVRVVRAQYSAETGRGSTGQVNVVTKSGTSRFHGTAYEFFRNDKLAANYFFNNLRNIKRPPYRHNDFGYTIGGPVLGLGKADRQKHRLFFFWSNEFRRVITYSTFQSLVPTDAMKQGIFPQPVCVARDGTVCLETATRITNVNPIAQQYIKDIWSKIPSGDSAFNLFTPQRSTYNNDQYLLKIDYTISPKHQLSVRYLNDQVPTVEPAGLFTGNPVPGVATTNTNSPGRSWSVRYTAAISSRLLNEAGFNYSFGAILSDPVGLLGSATSPDINVKLPFTPSLARVPGISISGLNGLSGFGPYFNNNRNFTWFDNLTKVLTRQTLHFGATANYYQKTENAAGNNTGTFSFTNTPAPSGTLSAYQGWANFLLGDVATYTQTSLDLTPDIRQRQWEAYAQDDIRVSGRLTVNVGVRLSNFYTPYDDHHLLTNFVPERWDPKKAPQINPANGNIVPGTGDPLNGIIINGDAGNPYGNKVSNENVWRLAPRLGIAYDPSGKGRTAIRAGYGLSYDSTLVGIFEQNSFANPPYLNNITISNTRFEDPAAGVPNISAAPKTLHGTPSQFSLPSTQTWSFEIQQALSRRSVMTVGYQGSKGTHLLGIVDINQVPVGLAVASGITTANSPITSANTPRLNAIRPYLGYAAINQLENWFNSNYNALQVSYVQRLRGASSIRGSYTWSKALTDAGSDRSDAPQNTYARFLEYARSPYDRTHVATISYIYEVPFGRSLRGVAGGVLKGWQLSGITTFNTGLPLSVTSGLGRDWGGLGIIGSSASGVRPDMVADPNAGAPHTLAKWFNTAAFAAVPAGVVRPGNAPRRVVIGPGFSRWDASLFKNVKWSERWSTQVRCELFNAFNHTNYQGVGTSLGSTTYGQVTSTREARRIQLAAKVIF